MSRHRSAGTTFASIVVTAVDPVVRSGTRVVDEPKVVGRVGFADATITTSPVD